MALFFLIYIVLGATVAGILITAVLAIGLGTTQPIVFAAVAGFVLAVPAAWWIAKKIRENA